MDFCGFCVHYNHRSHTLHLVSVYMQQQGGFTHESLSLSLSLLDGRRPMDHAGHHSCDNDTCCCAHAPPASESLDELAFARSLAGAASRGDSAAVQRCLARGDPPSTPDAFGLTALVGMRPRPNPGPTHLVRRQHYAARRNDAALCVRLLDAGADVHVAARVGGATPLHRAAAAGAHEAARVLVAAGASPAAVNADGETPAAVATRCGFAALAHILTLAGDQR
jgi:hypothetical protein